MMPIIVGLLIGIGVAVWLHKLEHRQDVTEEWVSDHYRREGAKGHRE